MDGISGLVFMDGITGLNLVLKLLTWIWKLHAALVAWPKRRSGRTGRQRTLGICLWVCSMRLAGAAEGLGWSWADFLDELRAVDFVFVQGIKSI